MRQPDKGNLRGKEKAPAALLVLLIGDITQLKRSASNFVAVSILYPLGQGFFTPFTPCHNFTFFELRQSLGALGAGIKFPTLPLSIQIN
jgi:hypothetical protein